MPTNFRSLVLFVALVLLASATAVVLFVESRQREPRAEAFQRLVGGLGFGPAVDLSGCAFGFDPRLDGSCSEDYGPVPGGACFCPRHAGSLFEYPSVRYSSERDGDAPAP
jgi:hypothetical protein